MKRASGHPLFNLVCGLAAAAAFAGCGGAPAEAESTSADARGAGAAAPRGAVAGQLLTTVTIHAEGPGTPVVTFALPFAQGLLPQGMTVAASVGSLQLQTQVDAKARHPDGSLRHAILTVLLPTTLLGTAAQVQLTAAPAPATSAAALDPHSLLATGFDTELQLTLGSDVYTAYARDLLKLGRAPDVVWLSGPLATEWIWSTPLLRGDGTAHPHLQARFNVRVVSGGDRARVDVGVDNDWAWQPGPNNFTYDLSLRVNGVEVFARPGQVHYNHARWHHAVNSDLIANARVQFDPGYLIDSRALPSYDRTLRVPESALVDLAKRYAPVEGLLNGVGIAQPYMPTTGGHFDIGQNPNWSVLWLLSQDQRAWAVMLGTADGAGSWPIHYRDQGTGRAVSIDDWPYAAIRVGSPSDAVNPRTHKSELFTSCDAKLVCPTPLTPDDAHQPALVYLPYLVTGDYFYLEELHFWSTYNMTQYIPAYRGFSLGLVERAQVRGQAWSLRTLAHTAYITPDDHPMKGYFNQKVQNNLQRYSALFLTPGGAGANALGFWNTVNAIGYADTGIAPWMDDFVTSTLGTLVELGFTNARPLLDFKVPFVATRMNGPGYCWIFGANYTLNVRDSKTGPLFASMDTVYQKSVAAQYTQLPCAGQAMATALGLKVGQMTGYADDPAGFPSNLQPALAVAADSGDPGGAQAWAVFAARPVQPDYSSQPAFAIVPRGGK